MEFLPRRVVWSPDGAAVILSSFSNDLIVRVLEDDAAGFAKLCSTTVTACAWYPGMTWSNPASCAFAMVVPFCPIQLIDSRDGHVRASYRCQYGGDRPASVTSVLFSGDSIVAGSTKSLFRCEITRSDKLGVIVTRVRGSILSLATAPSGIIAGGTSVGEVVLIDPRDWSICGTCAPHEHGVDVVASNSSKQKLFTSAKLENQVFMYDLRMPAVPELSLETHRTSSRYVSVSSAGDLVALGSEEGPSRVFSIGSLDSRSHGDGPTPIAELSLSGDRLALASGEWILTDTDDDADFSPHLRKFQIIDV